MSHQRPLREILSKGRPVWDCTEFRPVVQSEFGKTLKCGTAALGAEVYESDSDRKIVYHSCKSRICPSCGHRSTLQWQTELDFTLPAIPYKGIVFTMPRELWPIFRQNRHLLHDLPTIGADVIQQWAKNRHGARLIIVVVSHTFGRYLDFKCHLHILVSAGGLQQSQNRWIPSIYYPQDALMQAWRAAVVGYLLQALAANLLESNLNTESLSELIEAQGKRWWNIHIQASQTKRHFLEYVGRYLRHPPIAEHRITKVTEREVEFWTKDSRSEQLVKKCVSIKDFIRLLAEHVPDRYRHAVRYYGLLAPRSIAKLSAIFSLLGQHKRQRPRLLRWRRLHQLYLKRDPLIDRYGQYMRWVSRLESYVLLGGSG